MAVIMCPFQPFLILISTPLLLSHALLLHLHYEMHLVQSHLEEAEKPTDSTSRLILVGPGRHNTPNFFSSSLADVALWLGPYMSISSKISFCTRTNKVQK